MDLHTLVHGASCLHGRLEGAEFPDRVSDCLLKLKGTSRKHVHSNCRTLRCTRVQIEASRVEDKVNACHEMKQIDYVQYELNHTDM